MPTPDEKARRKAAKHAIREAEREQIRNALPVAPDQMAQFFNFLSNHLESSDCDGTMNATLVFLNQVHLPAESTMKWLQEAGAHCDCEVLNNAEEKFLFAFPEFNL